MRAPKTRFKIKLGNKIKQYRESHKLRQRDVALCIGCSQTLIGQVETGDGMPSMRMLYSMCILFKCEITDFIPIIKDVNDDDFVDL